MGWAQATEEHMHGREEKAHREGRRGAEKTQSWSGYFQQERARRGRVWNREWQRANGELGAGASGAAAAAVGGRGRRRARWRWRGRARGRRAFSILDFGLGAGVSGDAGSPLFREMDGVFRMMEAAATSGSGHVSERRPRFRGGGRYNAPARPGSGAGPRRTGNAGYVGGANGTDAGSGQCQ